MKNKIASVLIIVFCGTLVGNFTIHFVTSTSWESFWSRTFYQTLVLICVWIVYQMVNRKGSQQEPKEQRIKDEDWIVSIDDIPGNANRVAVKYRTPDGKIGTAFVAKESTLDRMNKIEAKRNLEEGQKSE